MAGALHTYGPTCRLGEGHSNPFMRRASIVSDSPPRLRAQFFYSSLLPIDDPLSPVPTAPSANRLPPRPFSSFDNDQLQNEWLSLQESGGSSVTLPVGLNRLHNVELPQLRLTPIYWDPVHDVSSVIRATWFYKRTMTPIPPDIANSLEAGYQEMKPWSEVYSLEVKSCLNVGPEAETRLIHRLIVSNQTRPTTSATTDTTGSEDSPKSVNPAENLPCADRAAGNFENSAWEPQYKFTNLDGVMYANAKEAQILRYNQLPTARGKRGAISDIRKGKELGIMVVRGFDPKAWLGKQPLSKLQQMAVRDWKLQHRASSSLNRRQRTDLAKLNTKPTGLPSNISATGERGLANRMSTVEQGSEIEFNDVCEACLAEERKPDVSDLVLVIHGIGQKLSERVETFHFTHSINAVRRQFAVELEDARIRNVVRKDVSCVMVLPVNWRSKLDFDDEAHHPDTGVAGLKDITPGTIPGVRSLVSDVLLDIPYYMSHHKPKMIRAVVEEANRIYRLWCQNNAGFQQRGRVHIIAHSLGSVMAMDILSSQPTHLPKQLDLTVVPPSIAQFDFDTTNIFFAGSPASLFLLLHRCRLLPRRGRNKPGTSLEDYQDDRVIGEKGDYGCLAVDNIYNIIHYNDPVAYKLNATVDTKYAAAVREAVVPTSAGSWTQMFGSFVWNTTSSNTASRYAKAKELEQLSAAAVADLRTSGRVAQGSLPPRNVEMDIHDFDAEKAAEKKMYMLNDNGQIDWFISSGNTIEFQYLDMLSAHSSYWTLQDFVRFVLVEVGREPGRDEVIHGIKVVKKKSKSSPSGSES